TNVGGGVIDVGLPVRVREEPDRLPNDPFERVASLGDLAARCLVVDSGENRMIHCVATDSHPCDSKATKLSARHHQVVWQRARKSLRQCIYSPLPIALRQ